jgi:anti-sigma factor RsiW
MHTCCLSTLGRLLVPATWKQDMDEISDEMLMAFADGELQPDDLRAVRHALTNDPSLRERLECFLRTKCRLARPFDDVLRAAIPEKLLSIIRRK